MLNLLFGAFASLTLAQTESPVQQPFAEFAFPRLVEKGEFLEEYELSFPSPFVSGIAPNDSVRLTILLPTERGARIPVVLLLHFWGATDFRLERSMASEFAKRGIGTVLMPLPYHLSRTPPGTRSGELAIQPDPRSLLAVMQQSLQDIERTLHWIGSFSSFDAERIGVSGTSLGAIVAALAFATMPRFQSGAFLLGGADVAHVLWHSTRVVEAREQLRRMGFTESRLREELSLIEPLNYLNRNDERATLVIGAKYDTIVPPIDTQKLIDSLGNVKSLWLETGHYGGALIEKKIIRTTASFFSSAFAGKAFEPPTKFSAPTVRIGFQVNSFQGLQVVAGIDLWRWNAKGDAFASALITPRGAQGFLGARLSKELAVGAAVGAKRGGIGLLWSQVF